MPSPARRSFLASLAALSLSRLALPKSLSAGERLTDGPWDVSWLDHLTGDHKQVFDLSAMEIPLHVVTNYLDGHEEVFGLKPPRVNAVVGIAGSAFPINAGDALWTKYELGRRWNVKDPRTGNVAQRNIFLDAMPAPPGKKVGVKPLQARGAIFWQCNNALNKIVRDLATDMKLDPKDVRAELVAGLNPGVKLVPAHTMFIGLAQERGCTYEKL